MQITIVPELRFRHKTFSWTVLHYSINCLWAFIYTKSVWKVLTTLILWFVQKFTVRELLYINQPNKVCLQGRFLNGLCQKMIAIGLTDVIYVCLLKKPVILYHQTRYFTVFKKFPPIFIYKRNGNNKSCAFYVYHIDKLTYNEKLSKKHSTFPK